MANDVRSIFDTTVLVSAVLFKRSVPRQAFDLAMQQGRILASDATLRELNDVLRRAEFDHYVDTSQRLQFLAEFVLTVELVPITSTISDCRDPRDNMFLELAVDARAICIVSGDADLLSLNPYRGIAIVSPQEFCARKW